MPQIKWKNKKNLKPDIILDKLKSAATIRDDGGVSYSSFEYMELTPAIYSMIDFGQQIDWVLKKKIVSAALNKYLKENKLDKDNFIKILNDEFKEINKTIEEEYVLLTSMSLMQPLPLKKIELFGCNIRLFDGPYPKKYNSRQIHQEKWQFDFPHTPSGYSKVIVNCKAKFPHEAVMKSINALDLLRSFFCLFENFGMQFTFGVDTNPINKIRLGGMHTLHKKSGKAAVDYFWYETNFKLGKPHSTPKKKLEHIKKNYKWALGQFSKSKYHPKLLDALLRYVRALDESAANIAALKLWGAIESIATPDNASNYDALTRRCSFFYQDRKYHKQMLEYLREYRNANVHAGEEYDEAKTCCYQMQFYFFELILFHLRNVEIFDNLQEANMFLDLPTNKKELEIRKKHIEKAIEFIS